MKKLFQAFVFLLCMIVGGVIVLLFMLSSDKRPVEDRRLCDALKAGNTNYLQRYLQSGGDINRIFQLNRLDRGSGPLLDVAIANGQAPTVEFLLKNGANPNERDSDGHTPLSWAIGAGSWDMPPEVRGQIARLLLRYGADPNLKVRSRESYTPLMDAAFLGEAKIVSILLDGGVNVNATNHEGLTALHFADNAEVARLLIAAGADPAAHLGGETPMESALRRGKPDVAAVLTNARPPVKHQDDY